MNKTDFIKLYAERLAISKQKSELLVNEFIDLVTEGLKVHGKVSLTGFLNFEVREMKERMGRNPRTNAIIKIKPQKSVFVSAGKTLKTKIKGL